MSLLRSVATVSSFTLLSRITGFVRDILIAALLGAGPLADAFFVAFKLPNMLRRLFAEGAFNAGFVPMFAGTLEEEGRERARAFAADALSVLGSVLLVVVLLAELFMPWVIAVFAPGFESGSVRQQAATELARFTFPYIFFIALAALYSGVLNSIGQFAAAAFAPVLLNFVLIAALLASTWLPGTPAHALAWGVALAGALQLAMVAATASHHGLGLRVRWPRITPEIKRLFALILPGAVGAGVAQINLVVDVILASILPTGAVSYLYYADRLNQLPLGVIGVAIGTALLPLLSRQIRADDLAGAASSQNRALELGLLLTLPAATALIVIGEPIVALLFERGAFDAEATRATAAALAAFAFGLPAYVLIKVLAPGFFARQDTKTPVKIAIFCLALNVVLALSLIWPLAHVGIALATAITNWVNAALLGTLLHRRGLLEFDERLRRRLPRMVAASVLMGLSLWAAVGWTDTWPQLVAVALLTVGGGLGYFGLAQIIGAIDVREVRTMIRARRA